MTDNKFTLEDDNLRNSDDGPTRAPRDAADVQRQDNDGTGMTRSERRRLFQSEWEQQALPTPPPIEGYHCCWLSSNNSYDPVHKRMRLGYEPVKASDVPGFEAYNTKAGEWKGFISINEMLLFKIPNEKYQALMEEMHYYRPLDEEDAIKSTLTQAPIQDRDGTRLGQVEGDGFNELGSRRAIPNFL